MPDPESNEGKSESRIGRTTDYLLEHKNTIVIAGVLGMGALSGLMNSEHGIEGMGNAAVNQMIHSGISAATLMKIHKLLSGRVRTLAGESVPIVIPAALTTGVCYAIHKLGIPYLRSPSAEPMLSTLPTAVVISILMPLYHISCYRKRISEKIISALRR